MLDFFPLARFTLLSLLFLGVSSAEAQVSVIRGPYLQKTSTNSTILRWRTNSATSSRVRFGSDLNHLAFQVVDDALTTEHRVPLAGLEAGSRYYYSIDSESGPLLAPSEQRFFETNRTATDTRPVRVWVLGDSGRGNENQRSVYQGYKNFAAGSKRADLMLMLGDNAYDTGLDAEYQRRLFEIYEETLQNTTLWPTFGNHDGQNSRSSDLSGPYYDSFSLPRQAEAGGVASGTEAYYSFDYGPIHFICLNSYDVERRSDGTMASWLKADLAANTLPWKIAYWHHPPYSKGSHDSDRERELLEMRENIVPLLEDGGVDLVLSGHSHSYERSKLIDGHYGLSSSLISSMILDARFGSPTLHEEYHKPRRSPGHRGTVYLVAGNAAVVGGGSIDHPIMAHSDFQLGSLILDIDSKSLQAKLIGPDAMVKEEFHLVKDCYEEGPCPSLLRAAVTPIGERTFLGRKSGALGLVQRNDGRMQSFRTARVGRGYGLIHRQNFLLPPGLAVERMLLILRSRRNIPMRLRFSFSQDGLNFRPFAERDTRSGFLSPLDLPLPFQLTGQVWIQLETLPLSARTDRLIDLRLDQTVLY